MVSSCRSGLLDTVLGLTRSQHLSLLTRQLYHCLADHTLMQVYTLCCSAPCWQETALFLMLTFFYELLSIHFNTRLKYQAHELSSVTESCPALSLIFCVQLKGSMLALALLSLELETCCPDWLGLTFDLLKKTQVPGWL